MKTFEAVKEQIAIQAMKAKFYDVSEDDKAISLKSHCY
jgi:hypothetical protein